MGATQFTRRGVLGQAAGVAAAGTLAATFGSSSKAAAAPADNGAGAALIGRAKKPDLHAMSFNIRYDREGITKPGEPDYWPERAPLVTEFLKREQPTLLGVQEAEWNQLPAIEAGLGKDHRMLGHGRAGGSSGEYSAIFYDDRRLEAREWDQYWLSDTPDVIGSATWGNRVTRIVTWVRFTDRETGKEFLHINSHFDHQSQNAQVRSAETVRDQIAASGLPVIFTADTNAAAEQSVPYDVLVTNGGLQDTWLTAARQLTPRVGTFPNYKTPDPAGVRIDWILATRGIQVLEAAINTWTRRGRWPSDHTPVQALLRLP
ncbi:hypothetical protein CGZ95_15710 [Enemella evansiae]|uniref:endonuclease/exonuclease/phosphatase family protein n=1 Tax=Enemella evansiae TaxID=2016499 RepID=UPI000B9660F1|nr:endonuclease/exonuclease/phosphatase family protein [Enemella evansiae]OYN96738.1 hypothetical protein CGZ95_15710 [Enemella evansiae]